MGKALGYGSVGLAFLSQLTAKDIQANSGMFSNLSATDKLRFIGNTVVGRITGINVFKDMPQVQATQNPAGIVNKWVGTGIGLLILNKITKSVGIGKILPDKVGKGFVVGGIIGGFFDAPARQGGGSGSFGTQGGYRTQAPTTYVPNNSYTG